MPSLWSVSIPAAAAATFVATWLLTPAPRAGAVAPSLPAVSHMGAAVPALQPPVAPPASRAARPAKRAVLALNRAAPRAARAARPTRPAVDSVYYPGCNAVRAAGKAPLYRGQPGYREGMDGDGDGIACEPHRNHW